MALGKNMKVDKLIPKKEDKKEKDVKPEIKEEAKAETKEGIEPEDASIHSVDAKNYPDDVDEQNIKIFFTPSRRKKTRRINVLMEGEFTINNVTLVKEKLQKVFENFDHIDFVLKNIHQIDLSALQLLHTIKAIYTPEGKIVTIDAELSTDDKSLIYSSGLTELLTKSKLTE